MENLMTISFDPNIKKQFLFKERLGCERDDVMMLQNLNELLD